MRKVSKSLIFFTLLLVFITLGAEPLLSLAEKKTGVPDKSFNELRLEMLELDLSSFGRSLSPYQPCLIYYWREEYIQLLDVDTFAAAFDSWKRRGSEITIDLSDLFNDSRDLYFKELVTLIQNTDLALNEKEFLELILIYILNQGEERFRSGYQLNALADSYLSKYPDSPIRQFVQSYIQVDMPLLHWSIGGSFLLVAAIPQGSIGEYFSGRFGMGFEMPVVSYRNIVLTPSFSVAFGSLKTSFSYDGEDWSGGFIAFTLDLSLGYRFNLLPKFAVLLQGGLGLLSIIESEEGEEDADGKLGPIPTASLGIVFEFFKDEPGKIESNGSQISSLIFGIAYRRPINPWADRFEGSELVFWSGGGFFESF